MPTDERTAGLSRRGVLILAATGVVAAAARPAPVLFDGLSMAERCADRPQEEWPRPWAAVIVMKKNSLELYERGEPDVDRVYAEFPDGSQLSLA